MQSKQPLNRFQGVVYDENVFYFHLDFLGKRYNSSRKAGSHKSISAIQIRSQVHVMFESFFFLLRKVLCICGFND